MTIRYLAISCVLIGILLYSCSLNDEKQALTNTSLQGNWKDALDPNKMYFAGTTHGLKIKDDSFNLAIHNFTDVRIVGDPCYSNSYTQYIKGTYYLGEEDSLILDGIFVDSLMNAMPESQCPSGPKQSGKYNIVFKGQLDENKLNLIVLSNPDKQEWSLTKY